MPIVVCRSFYCAILHTKEFDDVVDSSPGKSVMTDQRQRFRNLGVSGRPRKRDGGEAPRGGRIQRLASRPDDVDRDASIHAAGNKSIVASEFQESIDGKRLVV